MYIYMCLCIHVYMNINIYTYVYIQKHTYVNAQRWNHNSCISTHNYCSYCYVLPYITPHYSMLLHIYRIHYYSTQSHTQLLIFLHTDEIRSVGCMDLDLALRHTNTSTKSSSTPSFPLTQKDSIPFPTSPSALHTNSTPTPFLLHCCFCYCQHGRGGRGWGV